MYFTTMRILLALSGTRDESDYREQDLNLRTLNDYIAPDTTRTCDPRFRKPNNLLCSVILHYTELYSITKLTKT